MGLSLGNVAFAGFEIPSAVAFGGAQSLAVYRLPGGVRVADVLGPDDSDIEWQGVLSGASATDRAMMLDAMRMSGQAVVLAWDEFVYNVIIDHLSLSFRNSWWIPYKISCLVVTDLGASVVSQVASALSLVTADLVAAGGYMDTSAAVAAVGNAGAANLGTGSYASASQALLATSQMASANLQTAGIALGSAALPAVVSAAGLAAAAIAATGYIGRAMANFAVAAE
jgi:hypothetical protein